MPLLRVEPYDGEVGRALTSATSTEIQQRYGPEDYPPVDPALFAAPVYDNAVCFSKRL